MKKGELHLLPTGLGSETFSHVLPQSVIEQITEIKFFVAENIKTSRRFIKKINPSAVIEELHFFLLDKNTQESELEEVFKHLKSGEKVGLMSEAGCPGVADPGAILVRMAHRNGILVKPHVGPNSILLTLMGSGLNGQNFSFHGYAPIDKQEKAKWIRKLWETSTRENIAHFFMETPYRNNALLEVLLKELPDYALLTIGANLTTEKEHLQTLKVELWKKKKIDLHKIPVIFGIGK